MVVSTGVLVAQGASQGGAPSTGAGQPGTTANSPTNNNAALQAQDHASAGSGAMGDKMFVRKAIRGNNGELDAAKMALDKSQSDGVKQFAQRMVDDHTKMLDDLHSVAQSENIKYEDKPSPMAMKLHAKLEGLSGAEFDKAYVDGMVKDHKEDVRDFNTEIKTGTDPQVKQAAQKSLPTIQEHLEMVQKLQKSGA